MILGASLVMIPRCSSSVSCLPGPFLTSNSGTSPSAFLSAFPLFHGTLVTNSKFFASHLTASGILLTVRTYFSSFVSSSMIISSLLLARTPTKRPYPHLAFSFSIFSPTRCFQRIFSPNSRPNTAAFFPLILSYGVLPSDATSMRFIMYPANSHSHVFTGCRISIFTPILSSNEDFIVRKTCSTACTARSTTPFDPLLPFGASSLMVLAPVRFMHTSSTKNLIDAS